MRTITNNPSNYRKRANMIAGNDDNYVTKLNKANRVELKSLSFVDEYIDENEYCFLNVDKATK